MKVLMIAHLLRHGSALDLQLLQLTVARRIKTPQTFAHLLEKMATVATKLVRVLKESHSNHWRSEKVIWIFHKLGTCLVYSVY